VGREYEMPFGGWGSVSWDMQNFVFYFLRSRNFPITIRNTLLVAEVLSLRLSRGPVRHRDLEVVVEASDVPALLDEIDVQHAADH